MTSDLNDIYSRFYLRVQDYNLAGMEDSLVKEMLLGYVRSTISKPMVRRLFTALSLDEDIEEIEYTLRDSWDEDADQDFVEEILSLGMSTEWAEKEYKNSVNTRMLLSNSEEKWYSQASHMAALFQMYDDSRKTLRKLIRDRSWNTTIVNGET